jgi:hypothetical protein
MVKLSRRGVLTAVVCSEPFLEMGRTQARIFGMPELPLLVVPHPLGGISVDDVKARAALALAQLVKLVQEKAK